MGSTAISAQGSTLSIGNGTGAAKTISAIAVGYPTILTSAAHGLNPGDVVALAAFGGANAAALNGNSYVVQDVTTNTFMVETNTTGDTITAGSATATPVAWTQINNLHTFSGFDGSATVIDVTNLSSTFKEKRMGVGDAGTCQLEFDYLAGDTGHEALLTAYNTQVSKQFKLTTPDGATDTFVAYVKKFSKAAQVDGVVKATIDLEVSGQPTRA